MQQPSGEQLELGSEPELVTMGEYIVQCFERYLERHAQFDVYLATRSHWAEAADAE